MKKPVYRLPMFVGAFASVGLLVACGLSLQGVAPNSSDASAPKDSNAFVADAAVLPVLDAARGASPDVAIAPVTLLDDPGKPDCTQAGTSRYEATRWDQAITLDGKASDWPTSVKWTALSIQRNVTALCADFAVVWSPSAVHVMVRVEDASHEMTPDVADLWHNDSTEVFFGPPPIATSGAYRATDVQWLVDHAARSRALVGGLATGTNGRAALYQAGAHEFSSWGFVTEYAIPKSPISTANLSAGAMIPFSVAAGDGPGLRMDQTRYASWVMPRATIACEALASGTQYCCGDAELGPFCNTLEWGMLTLR